MNARLLELIKNPRTVKAQDAGLLQTEIEKHPYCQSYRALELLRTHLYEPASYGAKLSATAAYTTDKKILYYLINGQNFQSQPAEPEKEIAVETTVHSRDIPQPEVVEPSAPVFVEGELNRILFAGEEDFLERENTAEIDLEASQESGTLVTTEIAQNETSAAEKLDYPAPQQAAEMVGNASVVNKKEEEIVNNSSATAETYADTTPRAKQHEDLTQGAPNRAEEEMQSFPETPDAENFSAEEIIPEEKIEKKEAVIESAETSFHGITDFLPEVKITPGTTPAEPPKPASKSSRQEEEMQRFPETPDAENFSAEQIIPEEKIEKKEAVIESAETSFHGITDFLPEVKITPGTTPAAPPKPAPKPSRQEEEMQRLIAEVEAKVQALKKERVAEEPVTNHDINFAETQHFHPAEPVSVAKEEAVQQNVVKDENSEPEPEEVEQNLNDKAPGAEITSASAKEKSSSSEITSRTESEAPADWHPIQLPQTLPDALLGDTVASQPQISPVTEGKKTGDPATELPAEPQNTEVEKSAKQEDKVREAAAVSEENSNVPAFFNTWQTWLKLERRPPEESSGPQNTSKAATIEKFIEKEPKISRVKADADYLPKDRGSNISHLMTETLAQLYVEQKLYVLAINAFETLAAKHPDRKKYFLDRVQAVKELRRNP